MRADIVTLGQKSRAELKQEALLLLSKNQWLARSKDIEESIQLATRTAATTLDIARCSVWLYEDEKTKIKSIDLYDASQSSHESGAVLDSEQFPIYFSALFQERIISADNAHTNKYTAEFSEVYLKPLGINSMIDAPIWRGGEAIGVLCCEHVGEPRVWEVDEQNFVASVADFLSIAFELSEHKRTSDELLEHKNRLEALVKERTEELHKKNKELEAFAYSVSHDLRAPLRHIMGYVNILSEDYLSDIPEDGYLYVDRIKASISKLNNMIDSMLSLSRLSHHEMRFKRLNMSQLVRDLGEQFTNTNDALVLDVNETEDVIVDKNLMQNLITNLLENAIKFTQTKEQPRIEFGEMVQSDTKVFYFKDNGCGFDMNYVEKLFTVFQRLHSDKEYPGTGVGLSTVKRIIEMHNGTVWGESEIDKGAVFYFTLPR